MSMLPTRKAVAVDHLVQIEGVEEEEEEEEEEPALQEQYVLLAYQDAPRFLRNPFILSGYRSYFSPRLILLSLFRLHNETVNVWSHLGGLCYFAFRFMYELHSPRSKKLEVLPFVVFYISACLCMLFSALFHLAGCHSPHLYVALYRFDLLGICSLVLGSYFSGLYLGFHCHSSVQFLYLGAVSSLLLTTILFVTSKRFGTQKYHRCRVMLLVSVVAFSLVPIGHWASIASPQQLSSSVWGVLSMLLLYLCGFMCYWTRVPEKCQPGSFDLFCSSHQLWHMFVFLAAVVWERTLWGYARLATEDPCPTQ